VKTGVTAVIILLATTVVMSGGVAVTASAEPGFSNESADEITVLIELEEIDSFDSRQNLQSQVRNHQTPLIEYLDSVEGVTVTHQFWIVNKISATVNTDKTSVERIENHSSVQRVVRDQTVQTPVVENTVTEASTGRTDVTYGLDQIDAPEAWEAFDTRGRNVTVAVIDNGINPNHDALRLNNGNTTNNYETAWHTNYYPNGSFIRTPTHREGAAAPRPFDSNGHGTHVSGTIAGSNATGTAIGVAPDSRLIHSVALYNGFGSVSTVTQSLEWVAEQHPDVVTMSLGGESPSETQLRTTNNLYLVYVWTI
jgi:subtilisin family serine protease